MAITTQQLVVQLDNAPNGAERVLRQRGESGLNITDQKIINYSSLTSTKKAKWDAFVEMINAE